MAILGRVSYLAVAASSATSTNFDLGEVSNLGTDVTWNGDRAEVDVSHFGDAADSSFLMGRRGNTIDGTVRYSTGNLGQNRLEDNYFSSQAAPVMWVKWRSQTSTTLSLLERTSQAYVTNWAPSAPDEAPQDLAFSLRLTGVVSSTAQDTGPTT